MRRYYSSLVALCLMVSYQAQGFANETQGFRPSGLMIEVHTAKPWA